MVGVSSFWNGQEDPLEHKGGGTSGYKPHTCVPHSLLICCCGSLDTTSRPGVFEWSHMGKVKGYQVEKRRRRGGHPAQGPPKFPGLYITSLPFLRHE